MKELYVCWFFGMIILLSLNVASCDDDDKDDQEKDGVYDYLYIQQPCGERVVSPGHGNWKKYGFIMADVDGCYDPNMHCGIHLNVSSNYQITLRFQVLSTFCYDDFVRILDETSFRDFCGNNTPTYSLYSSFGSLEIQFHTGSATSTSGCLSGFKLYYTAYHTGECLADEFRCTIDGRCIPNEVVCDTYDNCGDWSDEGTAVCGQKCNETTYDDPSGVISSPNYPGNYTNYLLCDYYVNASSSSSSIAIIFQAFDTEECCDNVTISCATNSLYPSVKYSGSLLPQPLSIPWCSKAAINFSTNNSTVSTGFSLDYHISLGGCGDTVYTGSHGYLSSPNYPNSYDNNQNCSNIIWARVKSSFSITFLYMNVEECCDFVELSCLDNAEYGQHRFTGPSIPPKQNIPGCTQVLVWFYTDETFVQQGFTLEYSATPDPDIH